MKNFRNCIVIGLLSLSANAWATPGVYQINSACIQEGCFFGDDPSTSTVEITHASGTFILTSDIFVNAGDPAAIEVDRASGEQIITIDMNGYQIRTSDIPESNVNAISVLKNNSFVTIKNGSIRSFNDGINAVRSAVVNVDNMVFRLMKDDAVQAGRGRISNSSFDCNEYGINAVSANDSFVGDRLYLDNNEFTCITSPDDQQPVFSMGSTNVCKDNRINYDAGNSTTFQLCTLVGGNVCNGSLCTQNRGVDVAESKE